MRMAVMLCLAVAALAGKAKHEPPVVKGIKTPGVQIPFASLKAENEIPAAGKPEWLFFERSAYFPNASGGLDQVDAKTAKVTASAKDIAKPCGGMISAFTSFWIASCADGSLRRLDSKTLKEKAKIVTGTASVPSAIAASADSVWMITDDRTTLSRVDPDTNAVVGEMRVPVGCRSLLFAETSIWLACPNENKVFRINPATNVLMNEVEVSSQPEALASGEGSIWVLCKKDGKVDRIDPKTNKVAKSIDLGVPGVGGSIAVGEGSVWVTMTGFPLTRINPTAEKEAVVQQFIGSGGGAITTTAGAIWLSNVAQGTVWKIDPRRIAATLAE